MNLTQITAFIDLFRKGSAVADPKVWKEHSARAIGLAAVLAAAVHLARLFGYPLEFVDEEFILNLAGVLATLAGLFGVYATSKTVGVLPAKPEADPLPPLDQPDVRGPEAP